MIQMKSLLMLFLVSSIMIIGSCKKDNPEGDKTALTTLIANSDKLAASASTDTYTEAAIVDFRVSLLAVKTAAAGSLTQPQVDELFQQLTLAWITLESYVPLTALIHQAEDLSIAASTIHYPQTAIDNFNTVLLSVKTAAAVSLTPAQIDVLVAQLKNAITTFNSYGTDAYMQLALLLVQGEELANSAVAPEYPQTAIDNFKTYLQGSKTTAATLLTKDQINALIIQLNDAINTLKSQQNTGIDEVLYLNAGWHFDEGTGNTAASFSASEHTATFFKGNTVLFGAAALMPAWVAGVKGGSAVYLDKGAHLEVPYTSSFLPVDLSISVWVKPDNLYENNFIVSQNYWYGYKLQTTGGGKPFFTYKKVDGSIVDADNELDNCIKAGQWNHIVVTLNGTTKELKFFINGVRTKTWTEADKGVGPLTRTLTSPNPQPFIIGCVATDAEVAANFMDWTTVDNFGYFRGAIDELRIYNIALTDAVVTKLYNNQKP
jgi:flagellar basal body-associated protein FliL